MIILGIETSCDETAVGIVRDGKELLANAISSSMDLHVAFGGVVPEVAARSHVEVMIPVIEKALHDASLTWDDIDAIAVTYGAGLSGCLLIGVLTARTIAKLRSLPLIAINHVEAHLYANFITKSALEGYKVHDRAPLFPALGLIVSGGHSQIAYLEGHGKYTLLGATRDDAIGEAFDKVAKLIGLPYPGGISIAKLAVEGDPHKYKFPIAKLDTPYDYSYSGPKTAVLRLAQELIGEDYSFPSFKLAERLNSEQKADIAASFQYIAVKTIVDKLRKACLEFRTKSILVGGGVSASQELRRQITNMVSSLNDIRAEKTEAYFPDLKLCTDNGAMIATLAFYRYDESKKEQYHEYNLDIEPNLVM